MSKNANRVIAVEAPYKEGVIDFLDHNIAVIAVIDDGVLTLKAIQSDRDSYTWDVLFDERCAVAKKL